MLPEASDPGKQEQIVMYLYGSVLQIRAMGRATAVIARINRRALHGGTVIAAPAQLKVLLCIPITLYKFTQVAGSSPGWIQPACGWAPCSAACTLDCCFKSEACYGKKCSFGT